MLIRYSVGWALAGTKILGPRRSVYPNSMDGRLGVGNSMLMVFINGAEMWRVIVVCYCVGDRGHRCSVSGMLE